MFKISNGKFLKFFLFIILFIGIISNRIGTMVSYFFISIFIFVMLLFRIKKNQINFIILFFSSMMLFSLYSSFVYQKLVYNYNNLYFIQFFGSQVIFFYLFAFFINVKYFIENFISTFLYIALIIMGLIMIMDSILISLGMVTYQLMYRPVLETTSYLSKPLGIFGQFSINSLYSVVFFLLYLYFQRKINMKTTVFLFVLVTFIIVVEDSGSGYISYLLLFLTIFYKFKLIRYFLFPFILFTITYIISSNLIYKISIEYLIFNFNYFLSIIYNEYISHIHSIYDIMFGINGNYNFPIDFGPLFMIAKVGLFYFLFYSIIILYMIIKAPDRYFRMAIIILLIGNIHYPTLFYPIINVLLPLLLLYLINIKWMMYEKYEIYLKNKKT